MIYRRSMLLSLLVVPLLMNAQQQQDNDGGIEGWLGRNARWHYTKQFACGALEGAVFALGAQAAKEVQLIRSVPVSVDALVALGTSGVASQYVRAHSEKNLDGAYAAHSMLAWGANLAGYVVCGQGFGILIQALLKKQA